MRQCRFISRSAIGPPISQGARRHSEQFLASDLPWLNRAWVGNTISLGLQNGVDIEFPRSITLEI